MPRADLEHRQIERSKPRADLAQLVRESRVAGEEQLAIRRLNDERRPQRQRVAIGERASREVLRRRRGERQRAAEQRVLLPPIELGDELRVDAVALEMRADAKRRHERHTQRRERANALADSDDRGDRA